MDESSTAVSEGADVQVVASQNGAVEAAAGRKRLRSNAPSPRLEWRLFAIVCSILTMLAVLFVFGILVQLRGYEAGITASVSAMPIDHAAILTYNRALGAAIIKTSALFLGYLMVFTGALYVLRNATSQYGGTGKFEGAEGTLHTNSPGLVIVTLGVVLVAITIVTKSELNYEAPTVEYTPAQAQNPPAVINESVTARPNPPTGVPPSEKGK
jgi:hypothetical protein